MNKRLDIPIRRLVDLGPVEKLSETMSKISILLTHSDSGIIWVKVNSITSQVRRAVVRVFYE